MYEKVSVWLFAGQLLLFHVDTLSGRTFGATFDPKLPSERKGLYLNLHSAAPNDGLLTAWTYCYHDGSNLHAGVAGRYTASIMLYRRQGKLPTYVLVPESQIQLTSVRSHNESVHVGGFRCSSINVSIPIKRGDVIGACIPSPNGLSLLDEGSPKHFAYAVMKFDGQCSLPQAIDLSPTSKDVRFMRGMAFHVAADINLGGSDAVKNRKRVAIAGTDTKNVEPASKLSVSTAAGIVAAVVLFVMVTTVGMVLAAVCMLCHKSTANAGLDKSKVAGENEYGESTVDGPKPDVKPKVEALEYEIALDSIEIKRNSALIEAGCKGSQHHKKQAKSIDSYYSTPTIQAMEKKHSSSHFEEQTPYYAPASDEENLCVQLEKQGIKIIPSEEIMLISFLGSGQFGTVNKATWNGKKGALEVAVKTMKQASKQERVKFLQEAAIMGQFKHPNIVTLHGLVIAAELMLVVEFVSRGDLKTHLMSMNTSMHRAGFQVTNRLLLSFAQQIALGMNYLARKGFVHRDLAARNILISEKNVCKIADFGLSRDLQDENCYLSHGGKVPVKWTSPEAICFNKYSTASDVWSFGCVLYELWSLGDIPFSGFENRKVVEALKTGYRLSPPTGCPRAIYEQMMKCWHPEADSRPTFTMILLSLLDYEKYIRTVQTDEDIIQKRKEAPSLSENEYLELQQWYVN